MEWIDKEYKYIIGQKLAKNHLNSLRVSELFKDGKSVSEELKYAHRKIARLSRQVPPPQLGNQHKIKFLSNSVIGYP